MSKEKKNKKVVAQMRDIGANARAASPVIASASTEMRNNALYAAADAIAADKKLILAANEKDCASATDNGLTGAMLDRLMLDEPRLEAMINAVRDVAGLPDILGETITTLRPPSGLLIERIRIPIGVIAIIYESRPNVTADAAALCLKAGNASILRGGSESFNSCKAIADAFARGVAQAGLPANAAQFIPTTDRTAVGEILKGLNGAVDLIIPRGGKSLVARVQKEARAPVLGHLDGMCHVYVDGGADLDKAVNITLNSKMRRTGVCGAAETILIDRKIVDTHLPHIVASLTREGCEVRGDQAAQDASQWVRPASEGDWTTEHLDAIVALAVVDGVEGAIEHIAKYSSGHTEAIVTEDKRNAEQFLREVDSAIVIHNASTQYADGGEFGLGAEIGIATGRLHARGPVGVEGLTTYKYVVRGTGQVRR